MLFRSVLSGGPNSVYAEDAFGIDEEIFELGIRILGICYGMQLLTHKLGGKVVPAGEAGNREYGQSTLRLRAQSELFAGTPEEQVDKIYLQTGIAPLQNLSYPAQLKFKRKLVTDLLQKVHLDNLEVPRPAYRRRRSAPACRAAG